MDKITEIISHRENGSPGGAEHSLRSECHRKRERESIITEQQLIKKA